MSKVLAYYPLHYGLEYFPYSVESIYPYVDKIVILYTPNPSYGQHGELPNPETEAELQASVEQWKDKIEWKTVWADTEGQHRGIIENYAERAEYDIILGVDADEIWDGETLRKAIEFVERSPYRNYRVPFIHFWKDFTHVCRDLAQPHRFTKLSGNPNEGDGYVPMDKPVYHFGYAITDELMEYKWGIHGHKPELRPEWFAEIWFGSSSHPDGVHPTNREGFWIPEPYVKYDLPDVMQRHPRYI